MQNDGDSRRGCGFNVLIDGAKVGIVPPERAFEGSVQDGGADVEERLQRTCLAMEQRPDGGSDQPAEDAEGPDVW